MSDKNIYGFKGKGGLNPCLDRGQKTAAQIRTNFRKNMSSLAQEESRSISENVTWGQRKRFADGKINLPYKKFLGYEKGENGYPKIVEKEAKIVREIYDMFYFKGKTPTNIAKHLTEKCIPTPAGKDVWQASTIESILTNEKYKGDALLQKTFTVDFLTKKKKVNEGEIQQYYIEGSHPAIISPEFFDLVQIELERERALMQNKYKEACNTLNILKETNALIEEFDENLFLAWWKISRLKPKNCSFSISKMEQK